jgi:hypothetical protein
MERDKFGSSSWNRTLSLLTSPVQEREEESLTRRRIDGIFPSVVCQKAKEVAA